MLFSLNIVNLFTINFPFTYKDQLISIINCIRRLLWNISSTVSTQTSILARLEGVKIAVRDVEVNVTLIHYSIIIHRFLLIFFKTGDRLPCFRWAVSSQPRDEIESISLATEIF